MIDVKIEFDAESDVEYDDTTYIEAIMALERAVLKAWQSGADQDGLRQAIGSALAEATGEEWDG
jgi:hypothetical protein